MAIALQEGWRLQVEEILREHVGALGPMILEEVLAETGFRQREPSRREALHVFEVLKRELPSQVHDGDVPEQLLQVLFGQQGEGP